MESFNSAQQIESSPKIDLFVFVFEDDCVDHFFIVAVIKSYIPYILAKVDY